MSIHELYLLHDKGYSIFMDGDKKTFNIESLDKRLKGIVGIKKESRSSK